MHLPDLSSHFRQRLSWAVTFGALVIASCGGGSSEGDLTDRVIADDELMTMVLPKEELGGEYSEFQLGEDSGFQYADDKVDDATDKDDERSDLERFDFVKAYDQSYFGVDALFSGEGLFGLGTHLDLYQDSAGAGGDFDDSMADIENEIGVLDEDGSVLESYEEFRAPDIGDDAVGVVFRGTLSNEGEGNLPLTATGVQFRRGRIVANAVLVRIDDVEMQEDAAALAEKFDERIVAVLKGELEPQPTATTEATVPPPGSVPPTRIVGTYRAELDITFTLRDAGRAAVHAEASFRSPATFDCRLRSGSDALEESNIHVIVVGNHAWIESAQGWQAADFTDSSIFEALEYCPATEAFWQSFAKWDLRLISAEPETRNGIPSQHYDLDAAIETLRSFGFGAEELEGVKVSEFDVWVANDRGWIVAAVMDLTFDDATGNLLGRPLAGPAGSVRLEVNVLDAGDPNIRITPPIR